MIFKKDPIEAITKISNNIGAAIAGPRDRYSLEKRLMNLVGFVSLFGTLSITIFNFSIKLPFSITIQTFIALLLFIPIYYQMRVKERHKYFYGILMLIILIEFIVGFIYNWGTHGGTPFYFLIFVMIISIYQNKKFRDFLLVISFISLTFLFITEYYYPLLIKNTFKNEHQRALDVYVAVYFAFFTSIFIFRSITRNYKYEREKVEHQNKKIEQMLEREKRESASKINFFTNISHELRSPLSLIVAPLEKLMDEDGNKERSAQYRLIHDNAKKMNHLVDQILDFRKLEMGSLELKTKRVEIIEFMHNLKLSYSALAERNLVNLVFTSNINKTIINIDTEKFERAISNILNNAFKFTKKGDSIYIVLGRSKGREGKIQLLVKDTGIGIPKEVIQNIFEPFYQSPDTQYGTGLGLSIALEIIKLHGGDIKTESTKGEGSCFTIELPVARNQESVHENYLSKKEVDNQISKQALEQQNSDSNNRNDDSENIQKTARILLVEDNKEIVDFLFSSLSEYYQVIKTYDGKQGMLTAQGKMPDLIISDIMMPKMDGLELCKQIKSNDLTSHIPVILLTAKSEDEDKIEGLEMGADDYIKKPFNIKEIKARIDNLLETRKKLRERFISEIFTITPNELSPTSTDERFLQKAIQTAKKNMHKNNFKVPEFIEEMGMSRSSLHTKLKQLTNLSTSQFLLAIRLKKAAEIIKTDNKTILEVSHAVGIYNQAYFSKKFKELFGKLPREY